MNACIERARTALMTLVSRVYARSGDERGISLIAVMVIMTSVILVGVAIMTLGTAESDIVSVGLDEAQAFYAAEAGLERTQKVLDQLAKYGAKVDKNGKAKEQGEGIYPESLEFQQVRVGPGEYTVQMTRNGSNPPDDTTYDVVATGTVNGMTRQIKARMAVDSFAKYLFFANETKDLYGVVSEPEPQGQADPDEDPEYTEDDSLYMYSEDRLIGRVHVNDKFRIKGDPYFAGKVTTWKDKIEIKHGSRPTFAKGYEVNADWVPLPKDKELKATMATLAKSGGVYLGKIPKGIKDTNGKKIEHRTYQVILGRNGMLGTMSYRVADRDKLKVGDESSVTEWTDITLSTVSNGVIWFKDKIWMEGTLRGQITIGSEKEIYLSGDVLYESSTPGKGPDPDCTDLLGLVAIKKIKIAYVDANKDDVEIHGAIMSCKEGLEAEKVKDAGERGDLTIYGAVIMKKAKKVNEKKGDKFYGFHRKYYYDPRLAKLAPPFFPKTRDVSVVRWTELPATD